MRTVSVRLADLAKTELYIGYVGENLHTRIVIDATKMFEQYPTAAVSLTVQPPFSTPYPAIVERQGNDVIWDVTDSDLTRQGNGEIQLAFTVDETVAKTFIGRIRIGRSIIPTGDIPDPLDDFLTRAGAALTAIPETIDAALEEAKESGEFDGPPGEDGFSPVANVTKSGKTATITITDKAGTTTAQVSDGADGTDIIDDTAGAGDTDKTWSADKVASELGDVRDLVALPYDELTFPVAMNALCVHDGKLFKSTTAIQTEEAWTPSHWYDVTGGKAVTGLYTGLDSIGAALASKYTKPAGGIPASDLAAGVIPDVSGKADKADTVLDTTLSHGRANNNPVGNDSVAYGSYVIASGAQSQAFGSGSTAIGTQAHAEGAGTTASGNYSHSEGGGTIASANQAHAEGGGTTASGESAHSENGATEASGKNSHAEGTNTIANHKSQHAGGEWNVADPSSAAATERGTYAEIIGNGTSVNARSNARTLDWSGNEELAGDLTVKKGTADEVSVSSIKSALNSKYEKPQTGIPATDLASAVQDSLDDLDDLSKDYYGSESINLYNANDPDIIVNGYLDSSGQPASLNNYYETGYIPCANGDKFTFSVDGEYVSTGNRIGCFYAADKTFISGSNYLTFPTITIPVDCAFFRIALKKSEATGNLMIVKNDTTLHPYVPYSKTIGFKQTVNDELGYVLYPNTGTPTADRKTDIEATLAKYGECVLAKGNFYVSGISMPIGTKIRGQGMSSHLILLSSVTNGCAITPLGNNTIADLSIDRQDGNASRPSSATIGGDFGIVCEDNVNLIRITNCDFVGFTGSGIHGTGSQSNDCMSVIMSNSRFLYCTYGIWFDGGMEYNNVSNCVCNSCYYGVRNEGGNNLYSNCHFDKNYYGFAQRSSGVSVQNFGHGSVVGCSFNHNVSYSVYINGGANGMVFDGCQLWYATMYLRAITGIVFSNCEIGGATTPITFYGASTKGNRFVNCSYSIAPTVTLDGSATTDAYIVKDCYLLDGTPVSFST